MSDWIADRLEDLFGGPVSTGGSFGGGASSVVAWILLVVATAVVIGVVVHVLRNRMPRPDDDSEVSETELAHRRSSRDWADDAAGFEAEGEWKLALRARYRQLVRTLVDRGQVPDVAGRTTGELRADLDRTTPGASVVFDRASLRFELAWYAHEAVGRDDVERLRAEADEVLAAPHARVRSDGAGTGGDAGEPGALDDRVGAS